MRFFADSKPDHLRLAAMWAVVRHLFQGCLQPDTRHNYYATLRRLSRQAISAWAPSERGVEKQRQALADRCMLLANIFKVQLTDIGIDAMSSCFDCVDPIHQEQNAIGASL